MCLNIESERRIKENLLYDRKWEAAGTGKGVSSERWGVQLWSHGRGEPGRAWEWGLQAGLLQAGLRGEKEKQGCRSV